MLHRYDGCKSGLHINGAYLVEIGMHPCGDDAGQDLHQRIIGASFSAEIFHSAASNIKFTNHPTFIWANPKFLCQRVKTLGNHPGGVWLTSAEAPLGVSGGGA